MSRRDSSPSASSPTRRSRDRERQSSRSRRGSSRDRPGSRDATRRGRSHRSSSRAGRRRRGRSRSSSLPQLSRSSSKARSNEDSQSSDSGSDSESRSSSTGGSTKRKRGEQKKKANADSPIVHGRGIPRLVDPYLKMHNLIHQHNEYERLKDEPVPAGQSAEQKKERAESLKRLKRCWEACQFLAQFIPGVWETIENPDLSSKKLGRYYASLDTGAVGARSDDIGRISSVVAHWLNTEFRPPPNPQLILKKRFDRGPQHDLCGMLLCPIRHDWDDHEVRASIRSMKKGYALGSHPRVLFYNYRGDPSDLEKGYLQSRLLVKVYLHIFTAPASADAVDTYASDMEDAPPPSIRRRTDTGSVAPGSSDGEECSNRSVSTNLSMNGKVTPRSIAYAALLLLFSLSSAGRWRTAENGMNFPRIYYAIVDYFDVDPDDEESQAVVDGLLDWWNQQIFPDHAPSGTSEVDECDDMLAKQRAERKRKAAAASPLPPSSPPPA